MTVKRRQATALTSAQLRAQAGAELSSLCESFGADGRLSSQQVEALRTWLKSAAWADVPQKLRFIVPRVIVTRQMSSDEYREIRQTLDALKNGSKSPAMRDS